jgi:hypothetical protein
MLWNKCRNRRDTTFSQSGPDHYSGTVGLIAKKKTRFTCSFSLYEEPSVLNTEQLVMLCRVCEIISAVDTSDLADQKRE